MDHLPIISNVDDIFGLDDTRYKVVNVPQWGRAVRVRSMTGAEFGRWQKSVQVDDRGKSSTKAWAHAQAQVVAMCAVNENGERLFSQPRQIEALARKNAGALGLLFKEVVGLSGIAEDDIEELEGNYAPTGSGSRISASLSSAENGMSAV